MKRYLIAAAATFFSAGCSTLSDWRNPAVPIGVDHPPGIGVNLVSVDFAPPSGSCSTEVAEAAQRELLAMGVEVGEVTAVPVDEFGDGRMAEAPRRLTVVLGDTRCEASRHTSSRQEQRTKTETVTIGDEDDEDAQIKVKAESKYYVTIYSASIVFDAGISVQAFDADTFEPFHAWHIAHAAGDQARGENVQPNYPPEEPLRQEALAEAGDELSRWLLPWTEDVRLTFYDAEECGMTTTYAAFQAGDTHGAIAAAERSIEVCAEQDDRFRAAAYYNAGVLHFAERNHGLAREFFDAAAAVDPDNENVARAAGEVRRAVQLLREIEALNGQD